MKPQGRMADRRGSLDEPSREEMKKEFHGAESAREELSRDETYGQQVEAATGNKEIGLRRT
jgi:hypothetical protein